ncbi:hypothetical protein PEX2_030210 [Penicillium expansum]|uniref:Uncharacterized protein n=1 Tax=Penicillium expansum TaxID=27334 RepID=A0A0A2JKQ6_PENEN|nr:hypothetical protein PEX2_030210 [Penicillium expansum]KGO39283.1 hypothetical protein PEXP_043640 [Penicillium expansum]KGO55203.1 hypothetical protein PEX2_030210 [Penicillium expansum]
MPSLMDLPKEIRAMILKEVINGHRTPPISPSKSNMIELLDMPYKGNVEHSRLHHEKRDTHSQSNSLSLLLTSRQISIETQSTLCRMQKTTYVLDISVLNELDLFSTWISVPQLTTRLSTLHVDIRLFGRIITSAEGRDQMGCGGRLGFHWLFYGLLERFLRYGPVGAKKGPCDIDSFGDTCYKNRKISVENLILDFHSAETELPYPPDDLGFKEWTNKHWGERWPIDEPEQEDKSLAYKTRPEWLLEYLKDSLEDVTAMGYHTSQYGAFIYKRIGTISMLVDGKLETTFDLAGRLAGFHFDRPGDTMGHLSSEIRLAEFWKWKKATLLKREALGFPVVWPQNLDI